MNGVRVAIVGVGNCACSLVQGGAYYRRKKTSDGLIYQSIGRYHASDIEFVLGIDIDRRKSLIHNYPV